MSHIDVAARNLQIESELLSIVPQLEAAGAPVIVLKGTPLLRRLYGEPWAKPVGDNDLLVHRADAHRALDTLETLGYEKEFSGISLDYLFEDDNQCTVIRRLGDTHYLVDLHWSPFTAHLYNVPEELIWSRTQRFPVREIDFLVFDRHLTILHLAEHYVHDRFVERNLPVLARAWNSWHDELDVHELVALAREGGLHHALDYSLGVASDLGVLEAPPPLIGSHRAARLRRLAPRPRPSQESDAWGKVLRLTLAPPRVALRQAARELFPPLQRLAIRYRQPPSPTLYLRYPRRLLHPVRRAIRTLRRTASSNGRPR